MRDPFAAIRDAEQAEQHRRQMLAERCVTATNGGMNAEAMARAVYAVLREACAAAGDDPDIETSLWDPAKTREMRGGAHWVASWECGPNDWGIGASLGITLTHAKLVETYYGFDLCFYPAED